MHVLSLRAPSETFSCMLFVILLCCSLGKTEVQQSKPSVHPGLEFTGKPIYNNINQPQAYPEDEKTNLPVFTMDYARIQIPFEFTLWVLLASFAKIGFHIYQKITIWIPESCLLIAVGLVVGAIMHSVKEEPPAVLDSNIFFIYMLPPIILENGYFMPMRAFYENISTVLWYAVVGTLWNSVGIGLSLYLICQFEMFGLQDINLQENLLFASIISAVDPVAALNVFEDIGVNEQIYIVIFAEGLFNDAVTVALYAMLSFVADMPIVESTDVFLGVGRFFVVGTGGILFGLLFGFVAAFTSRFTNKVRELEPLFIFMYSYLAYLVAELFAISSVMAIIVCALTMKYYVEENVSQRSCTTIRHVVKMLANISETLIFFFLGVVTITTEHEWNWAYILFTLLFAFLWRGIGILVLTQIVNPFRTIQFNLKDQFGLAYGGLRGAVCFAMVFTLSDNINRKNLFVTASIAVIIFTVFIQGISIRPIMECINIRKTNKDLDAINVKIHTRTMEHVVSGIEDLCGQWSHHYWRDKFKMFNDRILRRILLRDNRAESSIVSLYKKLELLSALELLDTPMGDLSAAPSLVSLQNEKLEASRPKKLFLAAEIKKMHEILSKNMYKIRHRATNYTSKYQMPDESQTREVLIRRHDSIRRSLRAGSLRDQAIRNPPKSQKYYSLQPGVVLGSKINLRRRSNAGLLGLQYPTVSPHPSSQSVIYMRKLNAISEQRRHEEHRASASHPPASGGKRKAPIPTPRRQSSQRPQENINLDSVNPVREREPLCPSPEWNTENSHQRDNEVHNPLHRHSSRELRSSWRF